MRVPFDFFLKFYQVFLPLFLLVLLYLELVFSLLLGARRGRRGCAAKGVARRARSCAIAAGVQGAGPAGLGPRDKVESAPGCDWGGATHRARHLSADLTSLSGRGANLRFHEQELGPICCAPLER